MEVIDLDRLSPQDLQEVHRSTVLELDAISQNQQHIRVALTKYRQTLQSVQSLVPSQEKAVESLIPLTASMYMIGEIREVKKVTVDVGTGFFVEKSLDDAIAFFQGKIALVEEQMEKLEQIAAAKRNDLAKIRAAMQARVSHIQRMQQQQQAE